METNIKNTVNSLLDPYEPIRYSHVKNLKNIFQVKSSLIISIINDLNRVYKISESDLPNNFDYTVIQERVVLDYIRRKIQAIDRCIYLNRMHNNCEDYIHELNQLQQDKKRLSDIYIIKKHVPIETRIILSYTLNKDTVKIKKTLFQMAVANLAIVTQDY